MRRILLCLALLAAASPAWTLTEETEAGQRLTAEAAEFLDQLLGPGRAKVLVTVQGEKSETRTETDLITPIKKDGSVARTLPGYAQEAQNRPPEYNYLQKDQEHTLRQSGLIIKSLHATVILDSALPDTQAGLAQRLLPDLLRMDANRGDVLTVVKAPLMPPWRRLLTGTDGLRMLLHDASRALLWFVTLLVLLGFTGVIVYLITMSAIRALIAEIGRTRVAVSSERRPPALGGGGEIEELPEILPGGTASIAIEETGSARPAAALGRRFDFLASASPADVAEQLAQEKAPDLALLFGYLSDSHDALATQLFAALPVALQGEVSRHLSRLSMADPERLAMLENRLRTAVEFGIRGADRLGRILSRIPVHQREGILGEMMSQDPEAAAKVESSMLPFEQLADLRDADLRRLLGAVPYQEWGAALRGAPEALSKRVLMLLPAEAQAALRDVLETPQPAEKVLEARSKILSRAHALSEQGLITVKNEGRI